MVKLRRTTKDKGRTIGRSSFVLRHKVENPMNEKPGMHVDHYQDHFNPIQLHEGVGTLVVGFLALILLLAFLRQVKVNQRLIKQVAALESRA
jgi:hypothetical protein